MDASYPNTGEPMRLISPDQIDHGSMYYLLNSIVVPRPIAWVSTVDGHGRTNLAPHSYMTVAAVAPPTLMFVSIGDKDTVRNVRATGCFVINSVDRRMATQMNTSAADAPPGVSEFGLAGLAEIASTHVAAPRVVGSPVAVECELDRIVEVGNQPSFVVLGRAVALHVAERLFDERGRVDPAELDAIARMGGSLYSTTADRFTLLRPRYDELVAAGNLEEPD